MNPARLSQCVLLAALASCIGTKAYELPSFELAQEIGGPGVPMVFFETDLGCLDLPAAVPMAGVVVGSSVIVSQGTLAMRLKEMTTDYWPDFFVVTDGPPFKEGQIYDVMPSQLMVMVPRDGSFIIAFAFRATPSRLGFAWNRQMMVTSISSASAREAGLLGGDTLLSICGEQVTSGLDTPSDVVRLGLSPGDWFSFQWLRSGIGRMEGRAVALENPNRTPELPDGAEALRSKEVAELEELMRRSKGGLRTKSRSREATNKGR